MARSTEAAFARVAGPPPEFSTGEVSIVSRADTFTLAVEIAETPR